LKRLIIKHGERVIRHELSDQSLTIGRDPSCDLYFSDSRLSRRHALIEPGEGGMRFIDLGSLNGSFVESKRVEGYNLVPGSEVRLGSLVLTYEDDSPSPPPTVEPDDTAPIATSGSPPLQAIPQDLDVPEKYDETVILSAQLDTPGTVVEDDKTLLLVPKLATKTPDDTGTLIMKSGPPAGGRGSSDTRIVMSPSPEPVPAEPPPIHGEDVDGGAAKWMTSLSWSVKFLLLTSSVSLLVYFMVAMPLLRTLGNALREESLRRGRVILELLTETNDTMVGEGRLRDLNVEGVLREQRVKEALLIDLEGNVLAPSNRTDEVLDSIKGIGAPIENIHTFYLGRRGSDYIFVQPLLHRSRRVGIAVVVYEAATASGSWATAVLFLAFLVLLIGIVAALVVGRRMTLDPLSSLRDDVEAIVKGDADYVPARQAFTELSEVARSVNRLVARSFELAHQRPATAPPSRPSPAKSRSRDPSAQPTAGAPAFVSGGRVASEPIPDARQQLVMSAEGARFWVDENFIVIRAEDEAAELIGASASAMEGRHLIEAVEDQKLLEVILDAINTLGDTSPADAETEHVKVTAARDGDTIVVGLRKL
jgi:HAMP domain-containing protein